MDFYCAELSLAVELDGAVHDRRRDEDQERDEHLAALGVQVMRLRNAEVLERLDAVLGKLQRRCERIAKTRPFGVPATVQSSCATVAPFPPLRATHYGHLSHHVRDGRVGAGVRRRL